MRTSIRTSAAAALAMAVVAGSAWADEEKVALDKVPPAVMKAVKAKFAGAEIKEAAKEVADGKTVYEVMIKHDGHNVDVSVNENGTIASYEKEIEAKDLPKEVSAAVKAKHGTATIKRAEELVEGEKKSFEVLLAVQGQKDFEVVLDPKGKILEDGSDKK